MSRARIILLLLVVLCLAVGYAWIAMPKQRRIAPGQSPAHQAGRQSQKTSATSFALVADLDFSGSGNNPYQKSKKNLFAPLYSPPEAIKPHQAPRLVKKVTKPVAKPQKVAPVMVKPQGPKSIRPLKVLGYLNKEEEYTAFLSSEKGKIYLVKAGDVFADGLMVKSISNKKIIITKKKDDQQVVLQMGEVKSQRLPSVHFQSNRPQFKIPTGTDSNKLRPGGIPEMFKSHQKPTPVTPKPQAPRKPDKKVDKWKFQVRG